jgi:hypothetical protein
MTELDQSTMDPTWVPTRYQQFTVEEHEDRYNLRPRAHTDPQVGGSRQANETATSEDSNERENRGLFQYNLRLLLGRRTSG